MAAQEFKTDADHIAALTAALATCMHYRRMNRGAMEYRANRRAGRWTVDALMPAINGLSAWVTIADCGRPEPEDQMFDGFDPQRHAETIAAALNALVSAPGPGRG